MTHKNNIIWILEHNIFLNVDCMESAVVKTGHEILFWQDSWRVKNEYPQLNEKVIFHGSLENASWIVQERIWNPGAYCNTERFQCSSWYRNAAKWLLHQRWTIMSIAQFIDNIDITLEQIGANDSVFIRPNSSLKPFSGRVLKRDQISLKALDYGYYYHDSSLSIVIAPVCNVTREWRYVIVNKQIITGSAYTANERLATLDDPTGLPWKFAQEVAQDISAPDPVYVMDICESNGALYLLELNPFSGADLYACNGDVIVHSIERFLQKNEISI